MYLRRFPFSAVVNLRELGGYPAPGGQMTGYKQFLRGDALNGLSPEELQMLLDYGVNTVIDLRADHEIGSHPNSFFGVAGGNYHTVGLLDMPADRDEIARIFTEYAMGQMYLDIVDNLEKMKEVFAIIVSQDSGVILYHCSAGKDRTGVVTALLLMLAGVDKLDIIADYQVSSTYLTVKNGLLLQAYPDMPQHLADSNPAWIAAMMAHVEEAYGGIGQYLAKLGLVPAQITALRERLTQPYN